MRSSGSQLYATITETEIVLGAGGDFSVNLPAETGAEEAYLVIDVYDLDNPVHPEGHIGWWRFEIDRLPRKLEGRLVRQKDGLLSLNIADVSPFSHWYNPENPDVPRLVLLAVMRDSITNAILSIDRIPVLRSVSELEALRSLPKRTFQRRGYVRHDDIALPDRTVHIVAKSIFENDAVGKLCLSLHGLLGQHGAAARLYADEFSLALNDIVFRRHALPAEVRPDDVVFYVFSTFDRGLQDLVQLDCCYNIAYYPGITSPRLLQVFDTEVSARYAKAITQLPLLNLFDRIVANADVSAAKLHEALESRSSSIPTVEVVPPIILDAEQLRACGQRGAGRTALRPNFLYVGDIKSHNRVEDLLHLVAHYRALDPTVNCKIVGGTPAPAYGDYVNWVQRQLNLPEDAVVWLGAVSDSELVRAYEDATVYISMSEDESFCPPLLQAMLHDNLVIAYDVPGVREMLGDSGVTFSEKCHAELARQIFHLLETPDECRRVLDEQHKRASSLIQTMDGAGFLRLLADAGAAG